MGDRSLSLVGFPQNVNKGKVRIFMEKITGSGSVERLNIENGKATFTFKEQKGILDFCVEK